MINPETGEIGSGLMSPLVVDSSLSRQTFLDTTNLGGWREVVINEPYASWNLPDLIAEGTKWALTLQFYDDLLYQITLCDADSKFGATFHDFSWELEEKRKSSHDRYLELWLDRKKTLHWGTCISVLDRKSGAAFIIIDYPQNNPKPKDGEQVSSSNGLHASRSSRG